MDTRTRLFVLGFGLAGVLLVKFVMGFELGTVALTQVAVIALATLTGFGLGWFFSRHAKPFRTVIFIVGIVSLAAVALGDTGYLGTGVTSVAGWIGFLLAFGYWFGQAVRDARETTFGSARWAEREDLIEAQLVGQDRLRLGLFDSGERVEAIHYPGDRHVLTVAPTRSGKGTCAIIPNLLTWGGSVLVVDPKGENAMITADRRRAMGQKVHIVDPWGIVESETASRFNPIDWVIASGLDQTENAMLLADALVVADGQGDKFWVEEAKALLHGLILYVACDPHEEGQRHLARVRDLLLLDADDLKLLFQRMLDSPQHIVASTGARCAQKEERLLANVFASAQAQTHFLDSARLRTNLMESDFAFEDLKREAVSVYLVLPADRLATFNRWLRLLIQQAITVSARDIAHQPDQPVLFVLDEMAALGRLTMVEQGFGLLAGFGIQLWAIVQDLGQLKQNYGEGGYETLISNSGVIQYFGSRDRMTAEYFSVLCGMATVMNWTTAFAHALSSSSGPQGGSSGSSTTTTHTRALTQRKLAFADELMRMPGHRQLLFVENLHPILARKVRWFEHDELRTLGRNLRRFGSSQRKPVVPLGLPHREAAP